MNLENALKTIAFYDGYRDAFNPCVGDYQKDCNIMTYYNIEALIPVWIKLKQFGFSLRFDDTESSNVYFLIDNVGDEYSRKMNKELSIKDSLIIATALAINELEEK